MHEEQNAWTKYVNIENIEIISQNEKDVLLTY